MRVKPGYGLVDIHLKQVDSSLVRSFGNPERRRASSELREYKIYATKGFECIVSRKTGNILSIFFHREQSIFPLEEFGWTEDKVASHYEAPNREGGGLDVGGRHVRRWFSYDSGIGFHFGKDGRVEIVSVFAPKQVSVAKKSAQHQHDSSKRIAARRLS